MKFFAGTRWKEAWLSGRFCIYLLSGVGMLLTTFACFPLFFQWVERRSGYPLQDWILNRVPATDLSVAIFILIWATALLMLVRMATSPWMALHFIWSYLLLCLCRILTITLVPLAPPEHLLPLADPITNAFYGSKFVTRDLFFSGHTSTLFLMGLHLHKKGEKIFCFACAAAVAALLLIQHVHYTVDVAAAPFFALGLYWLSDRIVQPVYRQPKKHP